MTKNKELKYIIKEFKKDARRCALERDEYKKMVQFYKDIKDDINQNKHLDIIHLKNGGFMEREFYIGMIEEKYDIVLRKYIENKSTYNYILNTLIKYNQKNNLSIETDISFINRFYEK